MSNHVLYHVLYCTKFLGTSSKGFCYCADTIFILKFSKGHNSKKNVGGIMVLAVCMSSTHVLYLYQAL